MTYQADNIRLSGYFNVIFPSFADPFIDYCSFSYHTAMLLRHGACFMLARLLHSHKRFMIWRIWGD